MKKYKECTIYENPQAKVILILRTVYTIFGFSFKIKTIEKVAEWENLNFTLKLWHILFGKFTVVDRT